MQRLCMRPKLETIRCYLPKLGIPWTTAHLKRLPDLPVKVGVDLALAHHCHELRKVDEPVPVQVHLHEEQIFQASGFT